ncbi:MAG TPA: cobalamin-binding protein [Bryobacteraceae bacterium]|jgi:iron complex transport system substrate-binding protein
MNRVVSLIASATEIVSSLGEFESLVGRSHECDFPEAVSQLPCCTRPRFDVNGNSREIDTLVKSTLANALSVYDVLDEVLEQLQPTHIITQTQCEVCAVSLRDVERSVAARLASQPQIVSLQPNCLADIWDDMRRVARALGVAVRGEKKIGELQSRMREIEARAKSGRAPTVACVEWLEPLMAAGNWMPELVKMAGGVNLFGEAGRHSPWMTWDELVARDPDVIIAMPCGFDLERTTREMYWLTEHPCWRGLRAVKSGRVYAADGNQYFNRPGPRVVESLEIVAEILWGDAAGECWGWKRVQ